MTTVKNTTKALRRTIVSAALPTAAMKAAAGELVGGGVAVWLVWRRQKRSATNSAAARWMPHKARPAAVEWNTVCPTTTRMKAGPALLQQARRCSASDFVRRPPR